MPGVHAGDVGGGAAAGGAAAGGAAHLGYGDRNRLGVILVVRDCIGNVCAGVRVGGEGQRGLLLGIRTGGGSGDGVILLHGEGNAFRQVRTGNGKFHLAAGGGQAGLFRLHFRDGHSTVRYGDVHLVGDDAVLGLGGHHIGACAGHGQHVVIVNGRALGVAHPGQSGSRCPFLAILVKILYRERGQIQRTAIAVEVSRFRNDDRVQRTRRQCGYLVPVGLDLVCAGANNGADMEGAFLGKRNIVARNRDAIRSQLLLVPDHRSAYLLAFGVINRRFQVAFDRFGGIADRDRQLTADGNAAARKRGIGNVDPDYCGGSQRVIRSVYIGMAGRVILAVVANQVLQVHRTRLRPRNQSGRFGDRVSYQLGDRTVGGQVLPVFIHQGPMAQILVKAVVGGILCVQALQLDVVHIEEVPGREVVILDVVNGLDPVERQRRRQAGDRAGGGVGDNHELGAGASHGRVLAQQLLHDYFQIRVVFIQIVPGDAIPVLQSAFYNGALIQVCSGIGAKGAEDPGLAGCVVIRGVDRVFHHGHREVQRHRAVVSGRFRGFAPVLPDHNIGIRRQLDTGAVGNAFLLGGTLGLRPAVFDYLRSGEGDIYADLAAENTVSLIARSHALLKAILSAAVDLAGGFIGGGGGELLLGGDRGVGLVLYVGGLYLRAHRRLGIRCGLSAPVIGRRKNGGDGGVAENHAQGLIMALFVGAGGLERAGQHVVDVIRVRVARKGRILPDSAIGRIAGVFIITSAAAFPVPVINLALHSRRCR